MYGENFPDNAKGLDPGEKTIASTLKTTTKTACIGNMGHLKDFMPLNHGFDIFMDTMTK